MLRNEMLLAAFTSWIAAQVLKFIIYAINNKKFDISRLLGDGGMPSGHSATVSALATSSALCYGMDSFQFSLAVVFAIVVMHDASGIRLESGKQAKAINEMLEYLQSWTFKTKAKKLEELLGHTPLQVLFGSITGIVIAFLFHTF